MSILRLVPAFKDYIWGGQKLKNEYGVSDLERVSEAWVLSCHKDGECRISGGKYDGLTLSQAVAKMGAGALGDACREFERFPVLIKLIDAARDLSVQVHPDDEFAMAVEHEYGKTEMWYIVDAAPGAGIYYGFKREVSRAELAEAIQSNTLCDLLEFVPVSAGECYFIPAGTVHAIGAGLLIAEVQQNSNTTYRVYDYGRVGADGKPRQLHVEKAMKVASRRPAPKSIDFGEADGMRVLARCGYFRARLLEIDGERELQNADSFTNLLVLGGSLKINGEKAGKNESFFVPAGEAATLDGKATVLLTDVEAK